MLRYPAYEEPFCGLRRSRHQAITTNLKELKMATPHINAEMGDFADAVLMGDPLREAH